MAVNSVDSSYSNYISQVLSYEDETEKEDPLGRDAFLTMLLAQLQNQDPLNPLEGSDFSAQLAQFSSLEQQFNMNDSLEAIKELLSEKSENDNLLDYIGREVVSVDNSLIKSGSSPIEGNFTLEEDAEVLLTVYNSVGQQVAQIYPGVVEAGSYSFEWNGKDSSGSALLDGVYYFEITAVGESGGSVAAKASVSGVVTGVSWEDGEPYLELGGSRKVRPESITSVRYVSTVAADEDTSETTDETDSSTEDETDTETDA